MTRVGKWRIEGDGRGVERALYQFGTFKYWVTFEGEQEDTLVQELLACRTPASLVECVAVYQWVTGQRVWWREKGSDEQLTTRDVAKRWRLLKRVPRRKCNREKKTKIKRIALRKYGPQERWDRGVRRLASDDV